MIRLRLGSQRLSWEEAWWGEAQRTCGEPMTVGEVSEKWFNSISLGDDPVSFTAVVEGPPIKNKKKKDGGPKGPLCGDLFAHS